jgi:protein-S-isoprenylcysteine O-methyltransferase Ste14
MLKNLKEFFLTIFIPLFYLLAILIILKTKSTLGFGLIYLAILGAITAFIGLFLWGSGFLSLGSKAFSVLPKAKILKTGGIYKYFRHPIYLGIILTCFGLSLSLGSKIGLVYTIFIILPLNIVRALREEKILTAKFGQDYLEYRKRTLL